MAQRVNIVLEDDIDQSAASETVTFGLDGVTYEIDLNDDHAAELRNALAPYVGAGRKVGRGSGGTRAARRSSGSGSNGSGPNPREVRDWARSNGYTVSERGRVPADVIAAFEAAH
jgi:hypothetical protein